MMTCDHGVLGACPLCREIRRATAAEAELRETAAELATLRANVKALDLEEPLSDRRRLTEATALLRLCGSVQRDTPEFIDRVDVFLSGSTAQPAEPSPREKELLTMLQRCVSSGQLDYRLHADAHAAVHGIRWWINDKERTPEPTLLERIEAIIRECPELSTMYDRADAFWKIRDLLRSARGAR